MRPSLVLCQSCIAVSSWWFKKELNLSSNLKTLHHQDFYRSEDCVLRVAQNLLCRNRSALSFSSVE